MLLTAHLCVCLVVSMVIQLKGAIKKNKGIAYFATLEGQKLGLKEENGQIVLFDSENNIGVISAYDFYHENGFFHIISGIVYPKIVK